MERGSGPARGHSDTYWDPYKHTAGHRGTSPPPHTHTHSGGRTLTASRGANQRAWDSWKEAREPRGERLLLGPGCQPRPRRGAGGPVKGPVLRLTCKAVLACKDSRKQPPTGGWASVAHMTIACSWFPPPDTHSPGCAPWGLGHAHFSRWDDPAAEQLPVPTQAGPTSLSLAHLALQSGSLPSPLPRPPLSPSHLLQVVFPGPQPQRYPWPVDWCLVHLLQGRNRTRNCKLVPGQITCTTSTGPLAVPL